MVPLLGHCYNAFWESSFKTLDLVTGFGMKMLMQGLLQVCNQKTISYHPDFQ